MEVHLTDNTFEKTLIYLVLFMCINLKALESKKDVTWKHWLNVKPIVFTASLQINVLHLWIYQVSHKLID